MGGPRLQPDEAEAIARKVIVEGQSQTAAARALGRSEHSARNIIRDLDPDLVAQLQKERQQLRRSAYSISNGLLVEIAKTIKEAQITGRPIPAGLSAYCLSVTSALYARMAGADPAAEDAAMARPGAAREEFARRAAALLAARAGAAPADAAAHAAVPGAGEAAGREGAP